VVHTKRDVGREISAEKPNGTTERVQQGCAEREEGGETKI